jgi:hypothetical protein
MRGRGRGNGAAASGLRSVPGNLLVAKKVPVVVRLCIISFAHVLGPRGSLQNGTVQSQVPIHSSEALPDGQRYDGSAQHAPSPRL